MSEAEAAIEQSEWLRDGNNLVIAVARKFLFNVLFFLHRYKISKRANYEKRHPSFQSYRRKGVTKLIIKYRRFDFEYRQPFPTVPT